MFGRKKSEYDYLEKPQVSWGFIIKTGIYVALFLVYIIWLVIKCF